MCNVKESAFRNSKTIIVVTVVFADVFLVLLLLLLLYVLMYFWCCPSCVLLNFWHLTTCPGWSIYCLELPRIVWFTSNVKSISMKILICHLEWDNIHTGSDYVLIYRFLSSKFV